jgi:hypothetical protein
MVVHRYQALGDGQEEFEVGMWALRDIAAGEEVSSAPVGKAATDGSSRMTTTLMRSV